MGREELIVRLQEMGTSFAEAENIAGIVNKLRWERRWWPINPAVNIRFILVTIGWNLRLVF